MTKAMIRVGTAAMTAAAASLAIAADLPIGTTKAGSGDASVVSCDMSGFTASYVTSRGAVSTVTVGGIADPGCEGGSLSVRLTDSSGNSIGAAGPQPIPADGDIADNSLSLITSPQPLASQLAGYHVSIAGP